MSGVAKDDTNPTVPSEEAVSAVGAAEAGQAESPELPSSTSDAEPRSRRVAPHLRVVGEDDEFIAPAPTAANAPHQRIGALLRARRENLGFTLEQVSKETRVHLSHLRAIEDMTPNLLGAPVYAKGYIRAYARHLGLDEMNTLERYLQECAILKDPEKQEIAPPAMGRRLRVPVPVLGFLIVALVGAAAAFFLLNGDKTAAATVSGVSGVSATPADQAGSATGILADPAANAAAPVQRLRVVALKTARIEIRSAAGDKIVARDFVPGEPFLVRVGAGHTVSTNDGSAFEWRLGEQSLGLLSEGGPVLSQSIDIAAKREPVVLEVTPAPAPTGALPSTTAPATSGAAITNVPAKPQPLRPRTETTATPPAPNPAPPPVTASAPPAADPAVQTPVTPAKDPALAAYPDQ